MIDPERVVARFTVPGDPPSKARPRTGRNGNVYTPRETLEAEERIAWAFRAAARGHRPAKEDRYGIDVTFYRANRRTKDGDNMEKALLDALNKTAFVDDGHVLDMHWRVSFEDTANARMDVVVFRLN